MRIRLLLALAWFGTQVSAQITTMDSVRVTAHRLDQKAEETGRHVSVLTAAEIAALPATSVDELLRQVAGININSRGAFGVQSDIGMRGSTFSQVLILVDGVRLNDPLTGHFNGYIPVALSEIDRIEVVRGPAAAAFGADAVGGLIHIKTRTYTESNTKPYVVNGQLAMGDHDLRLSDMSVEGLADQFRINISYRSAQSDGEVLLNPNYGLNPVADSTYRSAFNLNNLSSAISYRPNEHWRFYLRSGVDQRDFNAKYFYTGSTWDESHEQVNSLWTQGSVEFAMGQHSSSLQIGYKDNRDSFDFNPLFAANEHTTRKIYANLNHTYRFSEINELMVGLQNELATIESTDRGDHRNNTLGVYAIYGHRFGALHTTSSLRMENNENFGMEFIPQLALAWVEGDRRLRASYGKAVRAADFTERFIASQFDTLAPGRNLGNPDLVAERSHTTEIGMDDRIMGFDISLNYFFRWSTDLIDFAVTSAEEINNVSPVLLQGNDYFYARNISESETQGYEVTLSRTFSMDGYRLSPRIAFTQLSTTNRDSVVSKYIANHPSMIINYGISFRTGPVDVQISNQYIERSGDQNPAILASVPSQIHLANLRIGFYSPDDRFNCFLQARNLFDVEYQEILGARMPGRWISGGIGWNIH